MLLHMGMTAPVVSRELSPEGRSQAPACAEPIDLKHLGRFTYGDAGLEQEVLGLFTTQISTVISSLNQAKTEKDWQIAAHTLKGSARAVGAWRLADLALQAERIGVEGDRMARSAVLRHIEMAATDARNFVRARNGKAGC